MNEYSMLLLDQFDLSYRELIWWFGLIQISHIGSRTLTDPYHIPPLLSIVPSQLHGHIHLFQDQTLLGIRRGPAHQTCLAFESSVSI